MMMECQIPPVLEIISSTESGAEATTSSDAVDTDGDGKPDASSGIISLQEINVNI